MQNSDSNLINIQIKTPKGASNAQISQNATVGQLKESLAAQFSCSTSQCCIICQGKIMKDPDSLNYYGIKDNSIVHLIIKSTEKKKPTYEKTTTPPTTTTPIIKQTPTVSQTSTNNSLNNQFEPPLDPTGNSFKTPLPPLESLFGQGIPPLSSQHMNMSNLQNILGDPNMNKSLMEMTSKFLDNLSPDHLTSLLSGHPAVSKFLESHPEFRSQFTPSNLKKMMEIFNNPVMAEEFMRNQNQAIQAIQNMPDGARQLDKIMRQLSDLDQPTNAYEYKPSQSESNKSNRESDRSGPNLSGVPIPNPWESNNDSQPTSDPSPLNLSNFGFGGSVDGNQKNDHMSKLLEMAMNSSFNGIFGGENNSNSQPIPSSSGNVTSPPATNNSYDSLLNNLTNNLNLNDIGLGSNQLQQFDMEAVKNLMTPENIKMFMNPRVSDALMKIQYYFNILKQEAPELFGNIFNPANLNMASFNPQNNNNLFQNLFSQQATASAPTDSATSAASTPMNTTPAPTPINLKEKFSFQLEQMRNMGFADETKCLRALEVSNGDINLAIEWLINNNL